MNLNTLYSFRHEVYGCLKRAADALFNTADALLTETSAHSFPELSLSPCFQRQWPSLYEAFEDGRIDHEALRQVKVRVHAAACSWGASVAGSRCQQYRTARGRYLP